MKRVRVIPPSQAAARPTHAVVRVGRVVTCSAIACCAFWFVATCVFAGVFGWAYARDASTKCRLTFASGGPVSEEDMQSLVRGDGWGLPSPEWSESVRACVCSGFTPSDGVLPTAIPLGTHVPTWIAPQDLYDLGSEGKVQIANEDLPSGFLAADHVKVCLRHELLLDLFNPDANGTVHCHSRVGPRVSSLYLGYDGALYCASFPPPSPPPPNPSPSRPYTLEQTFAIQSNTTVLIESVISHDGTTIVITLFDTETMKSHVNVYTKGAEGIWSDTSKIITLDGIVSGLLAVNQNGSVVALQSGQNGLNSYLHRVVQVYEYASTSWRKRGRTFTCDSISLNFVGDLLACALTDEVTLHKYNDESGEWSTQRTLTLDSNVQQNDGISLSGNGQFLAVLDADSIGVYDTTNSEQNKNILMSQASTLYLSDQGETLGFINGTSVKIYHKQETVWSETSDNWEGNNILSMSGDGKTLIFGDVGKDASVYYTHTTNEWEPIDGIASIESCVVNGDGSVVVAVQYPSGDVSVYARVVG